MKKNNLFFQSFRSRYFLMRFWLVAFLVLIVSSTSYANLQVSPMLIELKARPGSKEAIEIELKSEKDIAVKVTPFQVFQNDGGYAQFRDIQEQLGQLPLKIDWQDTIVQLKKHKPTLLQGKVEVPRSSTGTQYIALMIEEQKSEKRQVTIQLRYAVVIAVHVDKKSRPIRTKIDQIALAPSKQKISIQVDFKNLSQAQAFVEARAQIRDKNMRLVDTLILKTQAAWQQQQDQSRVFPQNKVVLQGNTDKINQPGEYHVTIRSKVNGKVRPSQKQLIQVKPEIIPTSKSSAGTCIRVDPDLKVTINQLGHISGRFMLENRLSQPIKVSLFGYSAQQDSNQLRLIPDHMTLPAKGRKIILIKGKFVPGDSLGVENAKGLLQLGELQIQASCLEQKHFWPIIARKK